MNISAPFIARPIATSLLAVALLLAGESWLAWRTRRGGATVQGA